nr:immunoglobulin light chain junction region [Macaca mulatta]MOX57791.1 immunoglobulin light chain junction region [Macaca mulatta]
CQQGYTKPVTF